ncbi:MAG: hypothetical protein ACI9VR_002322 [Cognaticolwellia sp.]|jgi:hypothetical protein
MSLASAWSKDPNTSRALVACWETLRAKLPGPPSLILVYGTEAHDSSDLSAAMQDLAGAVPWAGGTSCRGVMTEEGFHEGENVVGMLGLYDPLGAYGVGACAKGKSARAAAVEATNQALNATGRPGEQPSLLWLISSPGDEERVLKGIREVVGARVPVVGGSSADEDVNGRWLQYASGHQGNNSVVVVAILSHNGLSSHFHSGYSPTDMSARVTAARGRTLLSLNGEPAAVVYDRWTNGGLGENAQGGPVLLKTTLNPLGRAVGAVDYLQTYLLSHPGSVTVEGGLNLFTDVSVGDEFVLMKGSPESLITRAGRVAQVAQEGLDGPSAGGLVTYCAGCMLAVENQMPEVVTSLRQAMPNMPFLGVFTFGEQGCFLDGRSRHGNLMISVVCMGEAQ